MTIDEAIAHEREVARVNRLRTKHPAVHRNDEDEIEACLLCAEEHEQLAEWLEELKSYRASVFSGDMTQSMLKEERNKAIDDLREKLIQNGFISTEYALVIFDEIAEQLKAGK